MKRVAEQTEVKWKNIDIGASYYCITATCTEWLPLLNNAEARRVVCEEIARALKECGGFLSAYVLMPDHIHLLVYLPDGEMLHRFNRRWRGRSARRIIELAKARNASKLLDVMAKHANGKAQYAVWKEQTRDLAIWSKQKLYAMVDYIHANPVQKRLVEHPGDWAFSSWRFYEAEGCADFEIVPLVV